MTGFDNPLQTWNARYAHEDFHFGEAPNAFVRAHADVIRWQPRCASPMEKV
jgi:hypothetical protein